MTQDNPHPVDIYVGRRLKLRRNERGFSQKELGREIGVTFQQIRKYEQGTNRIGASNLYDIAKILGVSVKYFFDGFISGKDKADNDSCSMSDKEVHEIIKIMAQLLPSMRKKVLELAKKWYE